MATTKITLNELRSIVKQIIKEEMKGKDEDKIAKYEKYTYTLYGKKVKPDDIAFYDHLLGIEIDGKVYRPSIPDENGNIELAPHKGRSGIYT